MTILRPNIKISSAETAQRPKALNSDYRVESLAGVAGLSGQRVKYRRNLDSGSAD
jgi:hypothetical protein